MCEPVQKKEATWNRLEISAHAHGLIEGWCQGIAAVCENFLLKYGAKLELDMETERKTLEKLRSAGSRFAEKVGDILFGVELPIEGVNGEVDGPHDGFLSFMLYLPHDDIAVEYLLSKGFGDSEGKIEGRVCLVLSEPLDEEVAIQDEGAARVAALIADSE